MKTKVIELIVNSLDDTIVINYMEEAKIFNNREPKTLDKALQIVTGMKKDLKESGHKVIIRKEFV